MEKPTIPLDIGKMADEGSLYELKMHNESDEDAAARRANEAAEAALKRKMTLSLFYFALVLVSVIFFGCAYIAFTGGQDDKKWAVGIITAISSGLIGYLVGQGKK
jgi:fatty acid desaturase